MYTVSKGPSKFVAKTRIGIPSHLDNSWEMSKKNAEFNSHEDIANMVSNVSKPVFLQLNNKKLHSMRSHETVTPEHEEIVKFVSETIFVSWVAEDLVEISGVVFSGKPRLLTHEFDWSSVACKSKESLSMENGCSTVYYKVNETNNQLKDFVPFDLDSWWGKRLYNTITKSVP